MKKILYIVLDGLGDLPSPELGGKTSLESAHTPHMDKLAKAGKTGLMHTVDKNVAPESDIAVISILGYDAEKYYTGRGPLECYAAGLDVAFRVNFATMGDNDQILDRRVGRSLTTEEAGELAKIVNVEVKLESHPAEFEFRSTVGHRGALVIRSEDGTKLSAEVTNTDPAYERHGVYGVALETFEPVLKKCEPLIDLPAAEVAAKLTNEFTNKSHRVLEEAEINKERMAKGELSANLILSRDGGDSLPKFPTLKEMFDVNFGCFVEMPVEKGIALLTGMKIVKLPLPTKDHAKDYMLRAEMVAEEINNFDGLYIHIKGPDEPAHDGKIKEKEEAIKLIDEHFFGNLLPQIDLDKTIITVTADHATPCSIKAHSDDPVPVLIAGGGVEKDDTETFSERVCSHGELGVLTGPEFLPILVNEAKNKG